MANNAPAGFQHLVQPHKWLCAISSLTATFTGFVVHAQTSVPPENFDAPDFFPASTYGCIESSAMMVSWYG
jgi:hypothetical protein